MPPPQSFTGKQNYGIEFCPSFRKTFFLQSEKVKDELAEVFLLLEDAGPALHGRYAKILHVEGTPMENETLRELRWQVDRNEWRALYVFSGTLVVMLTMGIKSDDSFYGPQIREAAAALALWRRRRRQKPAKSVNNSRGAS